ncbi:hypothetical protein ES705_33195 [subsurface metagenome]
MKIIVGLDETGTETQMCNGWCYFGLPEDCFKSFNTESDAIKRKHGISGFHAKKYKSSEKAAYEEFFLLIEKYIVKCPISICSTYLYRKDWNKELHDFSERVFSGATTNAGIENPDATKIAKIFLPPLYTLSAIGKNLCNNFEFDVHFDSDDLKKQLDDHTLSLTPDIGLSLCKSMAIVANKYREINYPNSPQILDTMIQVLDDEKSNIIQAADVIGNFSNAYIFTTLGGISKKRKEKSSIFDTAFGKYLTNVNFLGTIKLHGDNDLELIGDTAASPFILGRC